MYIKKYAPWEYAMLPAVSVSLIVLNYQMPEDAVVSLPWKIMATFLILISAIPIIRPFANRYFVISNQGWISFRLDNRFMGVSIMKKQIKEWSLENARLRVVPTNQFTLDVDLTNFREEDVARLKVLLDKEIPKQGTF